jgi:hypothetical protein
MMSEVSRLILLKAVLSLTRQISTIRYIGAHTSVPEPSIMAWDVDAANPVGAEYMIMEKVYAVFLRRSLRSTTGSNDERITDAGSGSLGRMANTGR